MLHIRPVFTALLCFALKGDWLRVCQRRVVSASADDKNLDIRQPHRVRMLCDSANHQV